MYNLIFRKSDIFLSLFRPFIPDYIPAVGDIDAFIRVARHDGNPEMIGLKVLDEPAAQQSDPNVLELQIRVVSKQSARLATGIIKISPLIFLAIDLVCPL